MELKTIVVGKLETNCYLLRDDNHVLLIDPGADSEKILQYFNPDDILEAILLTHGHYDHTGAISDIVVKYPTEVYMNYGDINLFKENVAVAPIEAGDYEFGPFKLTVYETPGHSSGSVLYQCENYLFSGDTLFCEDIGRTDLNGGSTQQMNQSLALIKTFDPRLIVLPGHEERSTLDHELKHNAYLKKS